MSTTATGTHRDVPEPRIRVEGVTVRYGDVLALDDVHLTLGAATICGLIGMNGSGKSTLFRSIMGMLTPSAGAVEIDGQPPTVARRRGAISYVPQSEDIDWAFPLSVRDVVMTGRYGHMNLLRYPRRADHAAVDDALERVELTDYQHRQIGQLSGGQRKRVFVARGIAQHASILLLDEPFAGVDKRTEQTISTLLRELADDGATILVSTHDLAALPALADQAILLMRTVLAHDTPDVVITPDNLVRAFGLDPLQRAATPSGSETTR